MPNYFNPPSIIKRSGDKLSFTSSWGSNVYDNKNDILTMPLGIDYNPNLIYCIVGDNPGSFCNGNNGNITIDGISYKQDLYGNNGSWLRGGVLGANNNQYDFFFKRLNLDSDYKQISNISIPIEARDQNGDVVGTQTLEFQLQYDLSATVLNNKNIDPIINPIIETKTANISNTIENNVKTAIQPELDKKLDKIYGENKFKFLDEEYLQSKQNITLLEDKKLDKTSFNETLLTEKVNTNVETNFDIKYGKTLEKIAKDESNCQDIIINLDNDNTIKVKGNCKNKTNNRFLEIQPSFNSTITNNTQPLALSFDKLVQQQPSFNNVKNQLNTTSALSYSGAIGGNLVLGYILYKITNNIYHWFKGKKNTNQKKFTKEEENNKNNNIIQKNNINLFSKENTQTIENHNINENDIKPQQTKDINTIRLNFKERPYSADLLKLKKDRLGIPLESPELSRDDIVNTNIKDFKGGLKEEQHISSINSL